MPYEVCGNFFSSYSNSITGVDGGFDNNELEYEETHKIVRLAVDAILMAEGAEQKGHMGIKGLTKLLADNAPKAMKEQKLESYFSRKIAM
ncbi:hypothetical protein ES332_D05G417300v1 [Gossypium tomentosum]|uniref:Uncharacterized protein n=1 Tax=Gossypium tomentosum TaxID=34277 RepID=A0A5D2L6A3_GOSTO|nr:hypothetical protein ES332_D05G417300v1 [Gossypium tomentosum]